MDAEERERPLGCPRQTWNTKNNLNTSGINNDEEMANDRDRRLLSKKTEKRRLNSITLDVFIHK